MEEGDGLEPSHRRLVGLATYILFVVGKPYLMGFYRFLRYGKANMDTLIGIGTSAAFLYSFAVTAFEEALRPFINVDYQYYDVTIVVITFIALGKYLEARSKIKTGDAIEKLLNLQAKTALVIRDGKEVEISVNEVKHGDLIIVKPGAKIPVDGVITEGSSFIDESMVTGEPMPAQKKIGDSVVSGTINTSGSFTFKATKVGSETLRKLFAATAKDIRVLIIKLMDRLHNARTLEHVPKIEKRTRIALETLEIYAPIADRLGMSVAKQELEDAAFPWAHPKEYEKTRELLKERRNENEKRLEKTEHDLKRELADAGIRNFRTEARIKGVYSLYRKLERKDWDITKIYDILALRIIFPTVADCYSALGIIHGHWRPVPGKIKDYIAFPKPNGYQSIHTTVYTGDGGALEMQLRTEAQHREALYGIASHLTYKDVQAGDSKRGGLEWIRQFFPGFGARKPAPTLEEDELQPLMPEWVQELAHVQHGGEGGIIVNPKELSVNELEKLTRALARALAPVVGPEIDVPSIHDFQELEH
jgi:ppGpp synthetase/RelA/SpoT-type nucleotidyltranferase